jgi:hypothetical protein
VEDIEKIELATPTVPPRVLFSPEDLHCVDVHGKKELEKLLSEMNLPTPFRDQPGAEEPRLKQHIIVISEESQ